MIRLAARFAVGNPVAANLAMLALVACGVLVYRVLPREVFPDFSMDKVEVFTVYPGAAPEDVERLVTTPLEEALEAVDGVDEVRSISSEGISRITLTLDDDARVRTVLEESRDAVTRGDVELPAEAEEPVVSELETVFPIISVFVFGNVAESVLREQAERVERELETFDGVSDVYLTGNREPRLWIEVDPLALERYGLALEDVGGAIAAKARDAPLGSLATADGDWMLRVDAELEWARDLHDLPVRALPDGRVVRLHQVARMSDTFERAVTRARFNGQPCMHMQVNKATHGDIIDLAGQVRTWVEGAQAEMPPGTLLGTNSDLSVYVRNRLSVMQQSAFLGAGLVLAALLLFLNVRIALVTALGIPVAFLGGLLIAGALGVTMNMITMFALIVVLGMVVDDAIVVGENAFRLMEEGVPPARAAIEGTVQVGAPVIATILTSVVAFMPLLMLEGQMGLFLRPLPLVVSACLCVSLFEAITILPAHLAHWGGSARGAARAADGDGARAPAGRWYDPLRTGFARLAGFLLRRRWVTLAAASAVLLVLGAVGRWRIPFIYFDDFESKLFYVSLRLDPESSLDRTEEVARVVEELALALPDSEVESVNTLIGVSASDLSTYQIGQHLAQVWVELREGGGRRWTSAEVVAELRDGFDALPPEVESYEIGQPQSGLNGRAIELSLRGPDLAVLRALSSEVRGVLSSYAGARDVHDNLETGKREVRLVLTDHGRTLGFTEEGLGRQLRTAFEGLTYGRLRRGGDDVELVVKLPENVRESRGRLQALRVSAPSGARVPLTSVAALHEGHGPSRISHDQRERSVTVTADVDKSEGNSATIVADLLERFADLPERYPGYRLAVAGDYEDTARSLRGLKLAGAMALALIFLILGTLFRSYTQPLVVMFVIPFATIGVIGGHWVMDRAITMMSLIGLLALTGIVVNDSLILIDTVNKRRAAGKALIEALVESVYVRFRPILLTSVTTMLGILPLTFFATGQARFLQPMAISVFFGLSLATLLVLVIVPCAYAALDDILTLPRRTWRARSKSSAGDS